MIYFKISRCEAYKNFEMQSFTSKPYSLRIMHVAITERGFLCDILFSQPRILMAMSRDGLLPPFFSKLNSRTQVPVNSTVVTGIGAATLAFFLDVSELAGMVRYVIK